MNEYDRQQFLLLTITKDFFTWHQKFCADKGLPFDGFNNSEDFEAWYSIFLSSVDQHIADGGDYESSPLGVFNNELSSILTKSNFEMRFLEVLRNFILWGAPKALLGGGRVRVGIDSAKPEFITIRISPNATRQDVLDKWDVVEDWQASFQGKDRSDKRARASTENFDRDIFLYRMRLHGKSDEEIARAVAERFPEQKISRFDITKNLDYTKNKLISRLGRI